MFSDCRNEEKVVFDDFHGFFRAVLLLLWCGKLFRAAVSGDYGSVPVSVTSGKLERAVCLHSGLLYYGITGIPDYVH